MYHLITIDGNAYRFDKKHIETMSYLKILDNKILGVSVRTIKKYSIGNRDKLFLYNKFHFLF